MYIIIRSAPSSYTFLHLECIIYILQILHSIRSQYYLIRFGAFYSEIAWINNGQFCKSLKSSEQIRQHCTWIALYFILTSRDTRIYEDDTFVLQFQERLRECRKRQGNRWVVFITAKSIRECQFQISFSVPPHKFTSLIDRIVVQSRNQLIFENAV